MTLAEWMLLGVAGWSTIGVAGAALSWRRGERHKLRRGLAWLAGVWAVYLSVLVGTSLTQRQRVVALGYPQCFGQMCFTVTQVEEVPGFLIRDGQRLLRVSVQVANHGPSAQRDERITAYLVDAQGRRWSESKGVSGVGLDAELAGGATAESEPVFKVAGDATGLRLVFTHGWKQPGLLKIGDTDSLMHRPTVVDLRR